MKATFLRTLFVYVSALLLVFGFSAISKAQSKPKDSDNGIHVTPVDPNFSADSLKRQGYRVHPYEKSPAESRVDSMPDPKVRDELFAKAGLASFVGKWDHLEKDLLYQRALNYPWDDLKKKYPKASEKSLRQFQSLLKEKVKQ